MTKGNERRRNPVIMEFKIKSVSSPLASHGDLVARELLKYIALKRQQNISHLIKLAPPSLSADIFYFRHGTFLINIDPLPLTASFCTCFWKICICVGSNRNNGCGSLAVNLLVSSLIALVSPSITLWPKSVFGMKFKTLKKGFEFERLLSQN